jgi:hypothetical protein
MFGAELVLPFLIFIPGPLQVFACVGLAAFQVILMLSGNYAFFNFLSLGLSLSAIPNASYPAWFVSGLVWIASRAGVANLILPTSAADFYSIIPFLIVMPLSIFWIVRTMFEKSKALEFMLPLVRFFYPFRISNPYGLFAVMTKRRPELILEGSIDGDTWLEYDMKYKPGNVKHMPRFAAPHQPRLDWQMWFASLESFDDNLWIQNLITRLFEESEVVQNLFAGDPFHGKSPKYMRVVCYEYEFSSWPALRREGVWWTRQRIGIYTPEFENPLFGEQADAAADSDSKTEN